VVSLIDRSILSKAYFSREHVARHQLDSFNYFLKHNLQKVVNEQKVIETDIENRGKNNDPVWVEAGRLPLNDRSSGKQMDRRRTVSMRHDYATLTYAAPIQLGSYRAWRRTAGTDNHYYWAVTNHGGSLACTCMVWMMRSASHMGRMHLIRWIFHRQWAERVLMTLEDLASNKIMTEFTERYNERIYVAKVFSQFRGYRALVVVERNKKNLLEVSFPSVAGHLKFVDLMRALGMTNDQEVVNAVSPDEDILTFMMQNLEESECDSVEGGIMYVGKKLAPNQTKDYQRKRAEFVLDNYLLPHLNYSMPANLKEGDEGYQEAVLSVRLAKGHFLGRMAEACFDLVLNKRRIDDKDHYSNNDSNLQGTSWKISSVFR
jgi:DNA-directed RNA polymerase subunit B"